MIYCAAKLHKFDETPQRLYGDCCVHNCLEHLSFSDVLPRPSLPAAQILIPQSGICFAVKPCCTRHTDTDRQTGCVSNFRITLTDFESFLLSSFSSSSLFVPLMTFFPSRSYPMWSSSLYQIRGISPTGNKKTREWVVVRQMQRGVKTPQPVDVGKKNAKRRPKAFWFMHPVSLLRSSQHGWATNDGGNRTAKSTSRNGGMMQSRGDVRVITHAGSRWGNTCLRDAIWYDRSRCWSTCGVKSELKDWDEKHIYHTAAKVDMGQEHAQKYTHIVFKVDCFKWSNSSSWTDKYV